MVKFKIAVELDVTDEQAKALKGSLLDLAATAQAQGAKATITIDKGK